MKRIVRISLILVLLTAGIAVLGCTRTVVHTGGSSGTAGTVKKDKPGPPPHAPAHGYRHKHHDGVVLVYDSELCVYVVSGYKNLYYYKGYYYRWYKGRWQTTRKVNGPWSRSYAKKVPTRLNEHVAVSGDGKGKGKGEGEGKGKGNENKNENKNKNKD